MNFQLAKGGRSFKGALTYFMHDKKTDDMDYHPTTSNRVAWTDTVNCHGVGVYSAMRLMIATAENADRLKLESGHKITNKLQKPVYHFSLNWHPDELPDRDPVVMRKFALDALKALGMDHLQTVLIVHQDEPQPHIHILVNRVDPATGLAFNTPPKFSEILERLSDDYERANGKIYSPKRHEKLKRRDARLAKKTVNDFRVANDQDPIPDLGRTFRPLAKDPTPPPMSEVSKLKVKADAVKARHVAERNMLWSWFKPKLGGKVNYKQIAADFRRDTKPQWSAFGKQQAATRKTFYQNERIAFGPLLNATQILHAHGWRDGMRGYFGQLMRVWLGSSSADRAAMLKKIQERDRAGFKAQIDAALIARFEAEKALHAANKKQLEQDLIHAKSILHARQTVEREEISRQWADYYASKKANGTHAKHSRRYKKSFSGSKKREASATPPQVAHQPQPSTN